MGKRKFPNLTLADDLLIGEVHNFFSGFGIFCALKIFFELVPTVDVNFVLQ